MKRLFHLALQAGLLYVWVQALSLPFPPGAAARTERPTARAMEQRATPPAVAEDPDSPVKNVAVEYPRSLDRFSAKLRTLRSTGRGRLRISHWGDSHLTSDVLTGRLRDRLQRELGAAGPGFVLLGNPWPSYCHRQVKEGADRKAWRSERLWGRYTRKRPRPRDSLFGLAGISAHTKKLGATAWMELNRATTRGQTLAALDLYFLKQPGGGELAIYAGDKLLGRAVTQAEDKAPDFLRLPLPEGAARRLQFKAHSGEVRVYGVDLITNKNGVVYDTFGINGARATQQLGWDEALLKAQLARLAPDLAILSYGTNEVDLRTLTRERYSASLGQVLTRFRRASAPAECLLVGPPDRGRWLRKVGLASPKNLDWIVEEQRYLARRHGCAFWDQRAAMGGAGSVFQWRTAKPPLVRKDHVHLSVRAYRLLADALYRALLQAAKPATKRPKTPAGGGANKM